MDGLNKFLSRDQQNNIAGPQMQKADRNGAAALKISTRPLTPGTSNLPSTTPNPLRGNLPHQNPSRNTFPQQQYPPPFEQHPTHNGLGDSSVGSDFDNTLTSAGHVDMLGGGEDYDEEYRPDYELHQGLAQESYIPAKENVRTTYHGEDRTGSRTSGRFQAAENAHLQTKKSQPVSIGGPANPQQTYASKKRGRNDALDSNHRDRHPTEGREQEQAFVERNPTENQDSDNYDEDDDEDDRSQITQNGYVAASQKQLGPDYDDEKLRKMQYSSLQKESYDMMPDDRESPFPDKFDTDQFDKKMAYFLKLVKDDSVVSTNAANTVVRRMKIDEWEQTGDWLLTKISEMFVKRKEARQEQRKINAKIEKELEERYYDVQAKMDDIDSELNGIQAGAVKLMHGKSPMKK